MVTTTKGTGDFWSGGRENTVTPCSPAHLDCPLTSRGKLKLGIEGGDPVDSAFWQPQKFSNPLHYLPGQITEPLLSFLKNRDKVAFLSTIAG